MLGTWMRFRSLEEQFESLSRVPIAEVRCFHDQAEHVWRVLQTDMRLHPRWEAPGELLEVDAPDSYKVGFRVAVLIKT
jgi:hypothetical protein